jgi:hypothetical protein
LPRSRLRRHPDTDETFLVLDSELKIQMREGNGALRPRELLVMPRGAEHCPSADVETAALVLEPGSVVNTGDAGGELTPRSTPSVERWRTKPVARFAACGADSAQAREPAFTISP